MKRCGFTLIELLVVIAILAILAAVLFPVFANAREQSRKVKCQSNLKQIGAAVHLYADDWDGLLPRVGTYRENREERDARKWFWDQNFEPYLTKKGGGVWLCPSDDWVQDFFRSPINSYAGSAQFFNSTWGICDDREDNDRPLHMVARPATTIMFYETHSRVYGLNIWFPAGRFGVSDNAKREKHGGRSNYLFADGHVKAHTLRETLEPVVQWDRLEEWCPQCECLEKAAWDESTIQSRLGLLHRRGL